ncbi:MAG: tRNA preQ1(34) S-adenosylmethionine ribosyltransferase-isomerase QueA [Granulosicoccus sp.]|nr:tRNA preQ1(34) S-adenosylmethionine ribosyltransferase-isomerase QueA [Granulosicoccus sp.]
MPLSDFHFELPSELIAQHPLPERTASRLLVLDGADGALSHHQFGDLPSLLRAGDLLVMNDTRVIPARLFGRKETGGQVEMMIERVLDDSSVLTRIRASKSPPNGTRLFIYSLDKSTVAASATVVRRQGEFYVVAFNGESLAANIIAETGHVPLPPYIERQAEQTDQERYQTVYAKHPGAVAAPTAGLHFDDQLLAILESLEISATFVTLHVGAGTFQPVRDDDIERHVMHAESVEVSSNVVDTIRETRERGGRVIAVGTTTVRSLETAAIDGVLGPYRGDTRLFLKPGTRFNVVDGMITNFHLPESTLMMLVSAFSGRDAILRAYHEAVEQKYRFFSYGDAMLLWPDRSRWLHDPVQSADPV